MIGAVRPVLAALLVLALTGLEGEAQAQRTAPVAADCAGADAASFEDVYRCLSSLREERTGRRTLSGNLAGSECRTLRLMYRNALKASLPRPPSSEGRAGMKRYMDAQNRIMRDESLLPSCAMLALVSKEITGQEVFWSGCLGWGERPAEEHLGQCLKTISAGSRLMPARPQGCGQVLATYERGLRAADPGGRLPERYSKPDCRLAADYLASLRPEDISPQKPRPVRPPPIALTPARPGEQPRWAPCLDYDPSQVREHLKACLGKGPELLRFTDCASVRTTYETRLTQAYGRLPGSYVILPCSEAEMILAAAQAERDRIAAERMAKERAKAERQRQAAIAHATAPPPKRGFFSGAVVTWSVILAIILGGGFLGWRVLRRRRKA